MAKRDSREERRLRREEIREAEELELRLRNQIEIMKRSEAELSQRLSNRGIDSYKVQEEQVVEMLMPTEEADVGAVGGVALEDATPIPEHLVEMLSSTKNARERHAQMEVPDEISPVYDRYRMEWEERMRQLEESIYKADQLERENAERERKIG